MDGVGAKRFLTTLCSIFILITWCLSDRSAYITISPTPLKLSHAKTSSGDAVTIRCTGTPGDTTLTGLKISRVLALYPNYSTPTVLLNILHHNLQPQVIYPIEGSTATGRVTQNFLTLSLSRAKCEDAGLYVCEAAYFHSNLYSTVTANDTLTVEVQPGYLTVSAEPNFHDWVVNQTVILTCAGPLGTVNTDTQIFWHWEFWDSSEETWRPDGLTSDVTIQRTNQQPCYQNGSSQLTRQLRLTDSKRVYRCYVERDGVSFPQFGGRYEFGYVVSVPGTAATEGYNDGVVFGASLGAGITIIVVVLIVAVILMCLWSNRVICSDGENQDSISTPREAEEDRDAEEEKTRPTLKRKPKLKTPARIEPKTPPRNELKTPARKVALQTRPTFIDDDDDDHGYDVIDNSEAVSGHADYYYRTPGKKRGAVALPLQSATMAPKPPANSSGTSSDPVPRSSKMFYARAEEGEEEEEGENGNGSMVDLASAQQQKAAAEDVLRTLLSTRQVLSWKVSGDGGCTTFLLHLSPATHDAPFPGGVQQGRWRKKSAAAQQQHGGVLLPQPGGMLVALPSEGPPSAGSSGGYYYESPRR